MTDPGHSSPQPSLGGEASPISQARMEVPTVPTNLPCYCTPPQYCTPLILGSGQSHTHSTIKIIISLSEYNNNNNDTVIMID